MKSVVLSGFLGTGKSTVGPMLSALLGLAFVDTDQELARRAGKSVPELWRTLGEGGFREREAALVRELLGDGVARVLAFGGGTVTNRELRHLALDRAFVVTLTARTETILARLGDLTERPTLAGCDARARVTSLLEQRAAAYAECHLALATDDASAETAAQLVAEGSRRARVIVPLGRRTYGVDVVQGVPGALTDALRVLRPSSVVVVSDSNVMGARRDARMEALGPLDADMTEVTLRAGEEHKTLQSVETIWTAAITARVDRASVVVAFGGGLVGDLAGFAASTLLRGLRVVQVPTSLLAMVDASVGGKTGFDLTAGKNLIGSFHQPAAVVVDLAHLVTLPRRELVAGLAEVAKVALACDEALWLELERSAEALAAGDLAALEPVVRTAIELKAKVVRDDEEETGARALLNLGHTVGHALEAAGGYVRHRHGEAVALGLVAESQAAERLGARPSGLAGRVRALLERMGLPTVIDPAELVAAWPLIGLDKKRVAGSVRLPLLDGIGRARLETLSMRDLARALGLASDG